MNEAETRADLIDPILKELGWGVIENSRVRREFPISKGRLIGNGQRSKPDKADYVLQYNNRNLAIIEAKSSQRDYTEGVAQAKDYAEKLQIRFTYSTNGDKIYSIDMLTGIEKDVDSFPTPDELWNMVHSAEIVANPVETFIKDKFLSIPLDDKSGTWQARYYQINAINNVIEAIAQNKKRILLTLATGTGKTAIAFQIAWKLFNSKWNINVTNLAESDNKENLELINSQFNRSPRILFLADRNILADQAFNAFSSFEENALIRISPSDIRKKGKVPKNGSMFFTIFQTFLSGNNDTPYFGEYEKDFFDLIIIDECHRGGANDESTWRAILDYFSPAVQLGLTATPKREQNIDTYKYFGDPVYIYSLKQGINDGFLTPFKVKQISTTGDEYIYTSDDDILQGEINEERIYGIDDQNKVIEIMDIEKYKVQTFMSMIDQNQKTLVFCANQAHALAIRNLINQIVTKKNPNYCHRVTANDGKLGEQHLRDFQNNEKIIPTILTTSQKLSTGVDAPEIRNIVLMRPIKQLIEFKQIIGRGTRLYDNKDYFTIYDFVKAYKNFQDPNWDGEPLEPEPIQPKPEPQTCNVCLKRPCICEGETIICEICGKSPCECETKPRVIIKVKLSDGKTRDLQHMVNTSFWSPDGTPISAEEFLKNMYGTLPDLFKDENELREIWSKPVYLNPNWGDAF